RRENYQAINAPVNFPHIWTASWFDWVQYDGSIMQPLVRNAGEALGVHANVDMTAPVDKGRFSSAVPIETLRWIERSLSGGANPSEVKKFGGLLSPKWPEALGAIDATLAGEGKALYEKHCQGCHLPPLDDVAIFSDRYFKPIQYQKYDVPVETDQAYLKVHVIPQRKIGTDPAQANVLALRKVDTAAEPANGFDNMGINATVCTPGYVDGKYGASGYSRPRGPKALVEVEVSDGPMVSFALALGALVQQVDDRWFDDNFVPQDQRLAYEGDRPNCLQAGAGYKARPLNGIWATAPFLHNGSVPTLDALLRPADQRPTFVQLGSREFDPVKVGVVQPEFSGDDFADYEDGMFVLDTAKVGNRNTGHAFGASADGDKTGMIGPEFSDQERRALIEYLKSL
ncbi:MAG: di-heme-cytochrome C peroxidase, partial [Pseudomonadota bacterium]